MIYVYTHIETGGIIRLTTPIVNYLDTFSSFCGRRVSLEEFVLIGKKRNKVTDYLFFRSTLLDLCDNGIL